MFFNSIDFIYSYRDSLCCVDHTFARKSKSLLQYTKSTSSTCLVSLYLGRTLQCSTTQPSQAIRPKSGLARLAPAPLRKDATAGLWNPLGEPQFPKCWQRARQKTGVLQRKVAHTESSGRMTVPMASTSRWGIHTMRITQKRRRPNNSRSCHRGMVKNNADGIFKN